MKPPGVRLTLESDGPRFSVPRITQAEDKVWEAVQYAREAGWTAQRFLQEVREAWAGESKLEADRQAKEAREVFKSTVNYE